MELLIKSLELKSGEKNVYIEGYASASVKDLEGEIITEEALRLAARELTKEPYNKLFINHAPLRPDSDSVDKLPIGKVIDASVINGRLWIRAILNKAHPRFETIYRSIRDGFLNAFSIGFRALKKVGKQIKRLKILEVSLVSIPANPQAIITDVYEKSMKLNESVDFKSVFYPRAEKSALMIELDENKELKIF
ncbi:hypothetical protein DRP05_12780 [Archaeoglobales archaeon]|nr:MAG: hypothetical protein DRO97_09715 [Archaeoglobales archaeon]RLI76531.1 MAG: hypothetical protein DRP05_12780 [Archaeoglobales archaeon]